jgi:DNA-binding NarL/FixJ family response regulator
MRILIVEDSPTDRQLLKYLLEERFRDEAKFREAPDLKTAFEYLEQGNIDCAVLDLQLPDSVGRETFRKLIARFPDVPIIVMTHNKDRALAIEMIQEGAADYVLKNFTDDEDIFRRIVFAIEKHKRTVRMVPEQVSSIHRLERAQANMLTAHQSGEHAAIQGSTVETTAAIADISRKLFAELQAVSNKVTQQGTQQESIAKTVDNIDRELLRGHSGRPSMRSQVDLLEHRVGTMEKGLTEVKKDAEEHEKEERHDKLEIKQTQITNRTKLLIGILVFLGTVATAIATFEAVKQRAKDPGGLHVPSLSTH